MYLFLVVLNCSFGVLRNSFLNMFMSIGLPYLYVSILYAILHFYVQSDSSVRLIRLSISQSFSLSVTVSFYLSIHMLTTNLLDTC